MTLHPRPPAPSAVPRKSSGHLVVMLVGSAVLAVLGCETLRSSKPMLPVKEYERMLVGSFDADYIGTDNCLAGCHSHDRIRDDFQASTMGAQLSADTGMPIVDCESCHGPGSSAVEGITPEKVQADRDAGKETACEHDTFIPFDELPAPAMSLMCLKCHTGNATFKLHTWNSGAHAQNDVACSSCHSIHSGPNLIVSREESSGLCLSCHGEVISEFQLPSRHSLEHARTTCSDCHDPHGTTSDALLKHDSEAETCGSCHPEKRGPFAIEHGDLMGECGNCHTPHGSVSDNLLVATEPYLCLQCHQGHPIGGPGGVGAGIDALAGFNTRCSDCHASVHGSDVPSASGRGTLLR